MDGYKFWHMLPRKVEGSPFLEVLKNHGVEMWSVLEMGWGWAW